MLDEWMEQKGGRGLRGRSGVCQSAKNPAGQLAHRLAALPLREQLKRAVSGISCTSDPEQDMDIFCGRRRKRATPPSCGSSGFCRGKGAAAGGARRRGHAASLCDDAVSLQACGAGNAGRRRPGNGALRAGGLPDAAVRRRWSWGMSRSAPEFGSDICFPSACGRWR